MADDDEYICKICGLQLAPDISRSEYVCPNGHKTFFDKGVARAILRIGTGEVFTSGDKVDGLPAFQEEGGYTPNGVSGGARVDRTPTGTTIRQTASGIHHPQKGSKAHQKTQEESIGGIFIHAYNKENGTNFDIPKKYHDEDSNIDLEARDEQSGCALYIQVRVSDSRPWEKLKQGKTYVVVEDEQSAFDELWKGIEEKQIQCCDAAERKTLILLLDGWPPLPASSREKFKCAFAERLSAVGFREIWLVLREPTRSSTRLSP